MEIESEPLADMQEVIERRLVDGIFNGPRMYGIDLKYLDIRLELTFKNDTCHIIALSRGHHVRENPLHRMLHAEAPEGSPASRPGDGAIFLALVVVHLSSMNPNVIWKVDFVNDWWRKMGICRFAADCYQGDDGKLYIDSDHFLSWANYNLRKTGGKRTIKSRKRKGRKRKKVKSVKKR